MGRFAESKVQMNPHEIGKILNINRCMVVLVLYVGYRRGLHFIYLFAVLIATNTVVFFCQRVFILKKKKKMEISAMLRGLTVIRQQRDPLITILEMYS